MKYMDFKADLRESDPDFDSRVKAEKLRVDLAVANSRATRHADHGKLCSWYLQRLQSCERFERHHPFHDIQGTSLVALA